MHVSYAKHGSVNVPIRKTMVMQVHMYPFKPNRLGTNHFVRLKGVSGLKGFRGADAISLLL